MKQTELLLLDSVDNLGIVGDVVRVKPGFARNYLLPRGLATTPSPGAIKRLGVRRAQVEAERQQLRQQQEVLIERLGEYEMTLNRSANEQGSLYGGVSQHEIAEQMRADGFAVEDRFVRVGTQIKRLDTYQIPIVIDQDLTTEIKLWVVSDKPATELTGELEEPAAGEVIAELDQEGAEEAGP